MLRDVFYFGEKPNVHPRERYATNIDDARNQCVTSHFWIINEFCDYTGFDWDFDFDFLPDEDVWAEDHNNIWPSMHQKDSGTWLCPKQHTDIRVYRQDVNPLNRKREPSKLWKFLDKVDKSRFDFSWHPDPTDPPYIYKWGSKFFPVELASVLEYHTPGNRGEIKYMKQTVDLLPNDECITAYTEIDKDKWDMSWRPDPMEPPYIYIWGNKYEPAEIKPTLEYRVPGATEIKYMKDLIPVLPQWDRWEELTPIDKSKGFDFSWRPSPLEPPYIYVWGNKYEPGEVKSTLEYTVPGATKIKYMKDLIPVLPQWDRWEEHTPVDKSAEFDFAWRPDPIEPPFIYVWGNKYEPAEIKPTLSYTVPGATEIKYMKESVPVVPQWDRWKELIPVDKTKDFDFSWRPDPIEPPFIYVWGNKYEPGEIKPTLEYKVPGATEIKYMEEAVPVLPQWDRWHEHTPVDKTKDFDFSWRPSPLEPPFMYVWGNKYEPGEMKHTLSYTVPGATEIKYMEEEVPVLPQWDRWEEHTPVDKTKDFDFSWRPSPIEPPYIYVWGNKYEPAEIKPTLTYTVPGATEIKYMEELIPVLPQWDRWHEHTPVDKTLDFDFSWRPDPIEPPFIYVWGNKYEPAEIKPTLEYRVPGATEVKYMEDLVPVLPEWDRWEEHIAVDKTKGFDFSWRPHPIEPPYIYVWGNKYEPAEIKPTLSYNVPGATEIKYMNDTVVDVLPQSGRWEVLEEVIEDSFDFSWRPSPLEPPFIYVFGNHLYEGAIMPTLRYHVPGATEVKYVDDLKPRLAPKPELFEHLEDSYGIDYSWRPDPTSPPYIYVWGNQWNKPEDKISIQFVVKGATEYKYMEERATRKRCMENWVTPDNVDQDSFDYSWEPNPKEPAMIHEFATQWQKTGGPCYIVEGATSRKYEDVIKAKVLPTKDNWKIPQNILVDSFDFSWHPDATSPPYIYHFATQWALSGGPIYMTPKAEEVKYIDDQTAKALACKDNWEYDPKLIDEAEFDFSWHPYVEDQPYIYQFGTQWQKTGGPRYVTPGVHENSPVKYIDTRILKAKRLPDPKRFKVLGATVADFDYSWHPDETEEPFIYHFGNNLYPAEIMPTVEYRVVGAEQVKYVHDVVAKLGENKEHWEIPDDIDDTGFDYSWVPNPKDPAYIYEFATQWQKTGGPRYVVEGATEVNYVDNQKVKRLPSRDNWTLVNKIDEEAFDWSWHPDATSPPYTYRFPTQWALSGGPVYNVEGAKEIKYVEDQVARALPNKENWVFDPKLVDEDEFDYSWHPYVEDEPYIYQFGTQWQKTGGHKYMTPGVHEGSPTKYIDTRILKSKRLPNPDAKEWGVLNNYQIEDFDWSWHHDETEDPFVYVFGNKFYPAEEMPTVEYRIAGATEIKYVHEIVAQLSEDKSGWVIPTNLDLRDFDFSWKPSPLDDQPYIYQFGTQWQKTGGPSYTVEGATEVKYIENPKALRRPSRVNWDIPEGIDVDDFDFSWHPDETEPVAYIYQFGTQWALTGGPRYVVPGAKEVKYVEGLNAKVLPKKDNWEIPKDIDEEAFDWSWHPYAEDDPFIYQFGTQWQKTGGPRYVVPGAKQIKYIDTRILKATKLPRTTDPAWNVLNGADIQSFDFSWHPDETEEPYIYVFGNQHHSAEEFPTIEYRMPGATEVKYVGDTVATLAQSRDNWKYSPTCDINRFDFSWRPSPLAPPYIYQFGTIADQEDGPQYIVPGATEIAYRKRIERQDDDIHVPQYYIETTLQDLVRAHPNEVFWAKRKNINYEDFDFNWRPNIDEARYVQVFGSPDSEATQTYFVSAKTYLNGHRSLKFVKDSSYGALDALDEKTLAKLFVKPDMFYVDRGNKESQARFDAIKQRYPNIQKTRYLNSWVDTISRCINRSTTDLLWVLNSELDYSEFDFEYYPNPWQLKMVTIFGTQWSHWGTTYLVNRETFGEDTKYIKIIEHLSNLNFVKHIRAKATECVYDIVVVDHGNKETEAVVKQLETKAPRQNVSVIKHSGDYVQDMKQIVDSLPKKKEHYIWIVSSICDYSDFDFSYICDPFARDQLHVFPSNKQKFGDTFFMDVNKTRELLADMNTLEDYEKVNYNQTLRATRLRPPVIVVEDDTHVEAVKKIEDFPYAVLVSETDKDITVVDEEPMALWTPESKNIIVTSTGGTRIIVPKEAKEIKRELYEYPHIKTANRLALSNPMDIVFLSNGETGAEENWEHLQRVTKGLPNRVVRVDGVNGRVQAYHAAAEASNTPWAFTVFAKLKVSPKFDWNWQPDRMQQPKHYIFQAKNPVNGLIYGHQAMIAYNKKLTLENYGYGLDFTLDDEHASIELLSGTAMYNTDAFSTWRTAFREVIKLLCDDSPISKERLEVWLNKADPDQPFFQDSIKGALDAEEYFQEVDGDFEKLRLSYEWEWLKQRYEEVSY